MVVQKVENRKRAHKRPVPDYIKATQQYKERRARNNAHARICRENRKKQEQQKLDNLNKILETNSQLKDQIFVLKLQLTELLQTIRARP